VNIKILVWRKYNPIEKEYPNFKFRWQLSKIFFYQESRHLERGEYAPSLHLALRIARYFDVPVESVFSLEEFPRLS